MAYPQLPLVTYGLYIGISTNPSAQLNQVCPCECCAANSPAVPGSSPGASPRLVSEPNAEGATPKLRRASQKRMRSEAAKK